MNITKREKEVIKKLSEGLTTKEVAKDLYLSPYTIETHKRKIFQKMNARTLVQMGAIAVRSGIIALLFLLIYTPCISQSQFEIEGTIKASGLAGTGERMVMADENGVIKVSQQNPGILELRDSTGDVRFRFDADQGLFQILFEGDTIQEVQTVKLEAPIAALNGLKRNTKALTGERAHEFVNDRIGAKLNEIILKLFGDYEELVPGSLDPTKLPDEVTIKKTKNGGSFVYSYISSGGKLVIISGNIGEDGKINTIEISEDLEGPHFRFAFDGDDIIGAEKQVREFLTGDFFLQKKVTFDKNCNPLIEIENGETTTHKIHNPQNNSYSSNDGMNMGVFNTSNGLVNVWQGIDNNGVPALGVGDQDNQAFALPDQVSVVNVDNNVGQQVMLDKDGLSAYKDHDLSDPNDTPQFLNVLWDFPNNRILVCGDVHIKGNVTATGSITGGSMLKSELSKSLSKYNADNTLSGNVVTNQDGKALIYLDHTYSQSFKDFRYQLTTIGSFSKAVIGKEIADGSFEIWTETPHTKVSWQINASAKSIASEKSLDEDYHLSERRIKEIQRIRPSGM